MRVKSAMLCFFIFSHLQSSYAADYPLFLNLEPVSGDNKNTLMNGSCYKEKGETLHCTFNQLMFRKEEFGDEKLAEIREAFNSDNGLFANATAKDLENKKCDDFALSEDLSHIREKHTHIIPILENIVNACKSKNINVFKEAFFNFMLESSKIAARHCKVNVHSFDLKFNKDGIAWLSQKRPSYDPCGMINIVMLKPNASGYLWSYEEQRVITMPENRDVNNRSCNTKKTVPMVWSNDGDPVDLECDGIVTGY